MKIHQHLTKQQRYAKDIKAVSAIIMIVFVSIMLFSFLLQQLYTQERNQGRDIRSQADAFTVAIFKVCRSVVAIHFAIDEKEPPDTIDRKALPGEIMQLDRFHLYLQQHSIMKTTYILFQRQESTYAIIQVLLHLYAYPSMNISEKDAELVIHYTSQYISMLVMFVDQYTQYLAQNNAAASSYAVGELFFEMLLLAVFFFIVLEPAVKRFIAISEKSDELQQRLIETHTGVRKTQQEQGHSVTLPLDVVCVDHYIYKVARQGETVTVFYNEKSGTFICECKLYVQERFCFHTHRAKTLHDRIFRRTSVH